MSDADLYENKEIGRISTPMGDLKVTAFHSDGEFWDLYVDVERPNANGGKDVLQVCSVTVQDSRQFNGYLDLRLLPYNTADWYADEVDVDEDTLFVHIGDDRWNRWHN